MCAEHHPSPISSNVFSNSIFSSAANLTQPWHGPTVVVVAVVAVVVVIVVAVMVVAVVVVVGGGGGGEAELQSVPEHFALHSGPRHP